MGAWGVNVFENDDACDWLYVLEKSKDKSVIHAALDAVLCDDGYIESQECSEALAAAAVVLAGLSCEYASVPEEASNWLKKKPGLFRKPLAFDVADAEKAIQCVRKIQKASELKELWEESEYYDTWNQIQVTQIAELEKYI